jgi:CBS domain-containing protein
MNQTTAVRHTLHSQLAALIRRKPVTAMPESTLREAVQAMAEHRVGSIVVVEPESGRPIGIFTLRDLLYRVAAVSCDLDRMLMSVMSDGDLLVLNWRSTVSQAALVMARHGVHHVIVVDASGKLAGVVSQDDIYELQSGGGKAISGAIRGARDMNGLVAAAEDIRRLAERMLAEGAAAEPLTQLISSLNDHLTTRILELTRQEFALPKTSWCWLSFGSEGRFEQTLSTDQDNGIVFAAAAEIAAAARQAFLPFARAVNERLAACGFPLCTGNIMASGTLPVGRMAAEVHHLDPGRQSPGPAQRHHLFRLPSPLWRRDHHRRVACLAAGQRRQCGPVPAPDGHERLARRSAPRRDPRLQFRQERGVPPHHRPQGLRLAPVRRCGAHPVARQRHRRDRHRRATAGTGREGQAADHQATRRAACASSAGAVRRKASPTGSIRTSSTSSTA